MHTNAKFVGGQDKTKKTGGPGSDGRPVDARKRK